MQSDPSTDNPILQRLRRGEVVLCMPIRMSRSLHVIQMARVAGMDAIYMDMEHSTISMDQISHLALAAWHMGLTPLVRVPSHSREHILRSLEGGAAGVIVPHVNNPSDARMVVEAARFPPRGGRAMAGASAPLGYELLSPDAAARRLDARTITIVMIESMEAVGNADAIAAVDGVDVLLVGTGDLSDELGIHGQNDDPRIVAAYERVAAACRAHGRWLGVAGIKGHTPVLARLYELGARFLSTRTDETILLAGIQQEAKDARSQFSSCTTGDKRVFGPGIGP